LRVLAFEDNADIEALLISGGVAFDQLEFQQNWTSDDAAEVIAEFAPDILLLDHYIPPTRGLQVLRDLLSAVGATDLDGDGIDVARPRIIVGMSTMPSANRAMVAIGATHGIVKHDVATLDFWPRR
jgi:CheY-like chemotaxis protein